ncbi:hypothetical protein [Acaryochloris marina]|uniref:Uncharacterized protein n=1 Tax=Acaryochloris marina (strain MBIC 11017) TaxID=329726 RepID=A8ZLG6_ACAM1|nr:hypothetical protein [Acaryochloris marina]ABW31993.1 hypothetical protein AM1_B0274 [Acaryochloris marina MBIC11017]BDM82826.1 hypothetical protein AM10699_56870 [Acaryochloris marina MBIC10699]
MDNLSQRYVDDHSLSQDGHKAGQVSEKAVEDSLRLLVEGIYFLYQQRQQQVKISYTSPDDLFNNVRDALAVGTDDKTLSVFMDQHQAVQMTAQQYPENVEGLKQDVIADAKQDLLVEQQKNTPEFKQALDLMQKQQQAPAQSQGQSF